MTVPWEPTDDTGAGQEEPPEYEVAAWARVTWEPPETCAAVVLIAIFLVISGGLVAGILRAESGASGFVPGGRLLVGAAIEVGAEWAGPLLTIVLVAVLGLCWWRCAAWSDVFDGATEDADAIEAFVHVRRAVRLSLWARLALVLSAIGSIAFVVGVVAINPNVAGGGGTGNWSTYVFSGAGAVATVLLVVTGLIVGARFLGLPGAHGVGEASDPEFE